MTGPSSASVETDKYATSHEDRRPSKVHVSGDGNEFITLGDKKYYRHELMTAFAGTLVPERYAPYPVHQFGNAAALGLASFALTTFVLGLYLAGAMGIKVPNMVVGLVFFYGGFVEAAAGIWELIIGNCFAGTVLTSFGMGFWISYGAINVKAFGILAAYADEPDQLNNALGFFMLGWGIFCFMMLLCTVKSTLVFISLFVTLDIAFFVLAGYYFTGHHQLMTVGGVFCVISACCGWYCAYAGVATPQNSYLTANPIPLPVLGKSE
ncbi:putative ammonia transport outward protein [Clavispora lusitaniae]|uniref:Ammonia transport outward protein n=3 Tax=Clavispora lusitaniae TaxID=36911 RepID=C4XVS1_CLAL4|nr:uncharacterized protein CLUG_00038 [Clavispora lusitaniae ATCC 42720]KAF7583970.1 Accumulation of dyads protein 2 [Clavispora lusitaniae]EEQ35915.1 hypothetical protein CLUG_00038 [Clavispora lusitaniae ATCC 42720]OVF06662.1 putative ammonia transport outward protein [Clavispora lusitaniae]QFZ24964.1 putative ammonia transport outward protein [Clavispora lusitaniae]QFZ31732.1 putative ammonia transport outward protein [Clavispora lusitaniae]